MKRPGSGSLCWQRDGGGTVPVETVIHTALPGVVLWLLAVTGGGLVTRKRFDIDVDILRKDSKGYFVNT